MKEQCTIVKIGGKLIDDPIKLKSCLETFASIKGKKILIHGGASQANRICKELGIRPKMIGGRRITDIATLDIVTMVYAGLINKKIVSQLQALDCNAIGISGADGNSITAHKRPHNRIDYGFAGDLDQINFEFLNFVLLEDIVPVICPITHDNNGQLLNTNADTIASKTAQTFSTHYQVSLKYCFEYDGVLEDITNHEKTFSHLSVNQIESMLERQDFHNGMIPKLLNASQASRNHVKKVVICGVGNLLTENNATQIVK